MPGAMAIGDALARRTGKAPFIIGSPEPALNVGWRVELDAALPFAQAGSGSVRRCAGRRSGFDCRDQPLCCGTGDFTSGRKASPFCLRHLVRRSCRPEHTRSHNLRLSWRAGSCGSSGALEFWFGCWIGSRSNRTCWRTRSGPLRARPDRPASNTGCKPGSNLATDLRNAIAGRPVYVHLDCDVLKPGIVPTDFVVPGGMSLDDLHTCAAVIAEHDFVGIEIAEFQSTWEPGGDEVSVDPLLDALAPVLSA